MYETSDIILAAYLKCKDIKLTDIKVENKKGTFVFESVPQQYITDFNLGKAWVEPIAFNTHIRQLTTSVRRISQ